MTARYRSTGLQFDNRLWVCGYCHAQCVDYPTMKEHREKRCKVRKAIQRQREAKQFSLARSLTSPPAIAEGQKVLEEWGVR